MDKIEVNWIRMNTGKKLFVIINREFKRHNEYLVFRPWTQLYEWMPESFIKDSKKHIPNKEEKKQSIDAIFSYKMQRKLNDG